MKFMYMEYAYNIKCKLNAVINKTCDDNLSEN